jgi:probable phosphoglycerate mutase
MAYEQHRYTVPDDAVEVVLVRHGATQAAEEGRSFELLDGHGNPPLAERGRVQADLVGARLAAGDPIDLIFTSDLRRTLETARPLVDKTGLEPRQLPSLREVHLGDWEGGEFRVRMHHRDPVALRVLAEQRWDVIPGGEPAESFTARVREGFDEIVAATGPGRRAVAFLHGAVIGEICRQVTGSAPFAFLNSENTSITRIVVSAEGTYRLRDFNVTTHLDGTV